MKTIKENTLNKIKSLEGQIAYCVECIVDDNTSEWEKKEYKEVKESTELELAELYQHVLSHPKIFA